MGNYFIQTVDGKKAVKSLKEFEFRGEQFFLHVSVDSRDVIKITHRQTGLGAGQVQRYESYRAVGMKRVERGKDALLGDALFYLGRVPEDRFKAAIEQARSTSQ